MAYKGDSLQIVFHVHTSIYLDLQRLVLQPAKILDIVRMCFGHVGFKEAVREKAFAAVQEAGSEAQKSECLWQLQGR